MLVLSLIDNSYWILQGNHRAKITHQREFLLYTVVIFAFYSHSLIKLFKEGYFSNSYSEVQKKYSKILADISF